MIYVDVYIEELIGSEFIAKISAIKLGIYNTKWIKYLIAESTELKY